MNRLLFGVLGIVAWGLPWGLFAAEPYFQIRVIDESTGRGVPLVELETVNNIRLVTDSGGNIAFLEPGLVGQDVFFHIRSHGYEYPPDGFGFRGVRLKITSGGSATIKLPRVNIAERLYRITGGGIYRDTLLLGEKPPVAEPVLNAQVLGSDSVVNALYRGRLYWFWGDTNRPSYPLGNFHVPGATSRLPGAGGLDPSQGINLEYFIGADGFAKSTAKMPGNGPTWIFGMTVLSNADGQSELWTGYSKIEPPFKTDARGVARFNDQTSEFDNITAFVPLPVLYPEGQALTLRDGEADYVYFCTPYPLVRVRATPAAYCDPTQYEAYTCLKAGRRLAEHQVERDAAGKVHFAWKRGTPAVGPREQLELIQAGDLTPTEALLQLRDRDTGKLILAHTGTVNWNAFRKRWIMIFVEFGGTSQLGEMWYSEADAPLGSWNYAVKVATHDRYSFYNPKQHVYFDQEGGRLVYFEGTYTHSFSGNNVQTPRYDYNQLLYRLDLADLGLALPRPFYQAAPDKVFYTGTAGVTDRPETSPIAFLALDRPGRNSIPVYAAPTDRGFSLSLQQPPSPASSVPLFYALPADLKDPPTTTMALHEFVQDVTGQRAYTIDSAWNAPGFKRAEKAVCRVWKAQ